MDRLHEHGACPGMPSAVAATYAEAGTLWARCGDDPAAQRWQHDAALCGVAGPARGRRAARAWEHLQGGT